MKVSVKQIFIAFVSMVCTLGVLWGGQWLYVTTAVQSPLARSVGQIAGVQRVSVQNSQVIVQMKPQANLMTVYRAVLRQVGSTPGRTPAGITVQSHADATLNSLAGRVQFIVAQGEATGQYVAMRSNIDRLAARNHSSATVQLGSTRLYMTFRHQGFVLYDVAPLTMGGTIRG